MYNAPWAASGTHRSRRRGDRQGENRGRNAGRFHIWLAFSKYSVHVHSPDGNLPSRYVQKATVAVFGPVELGQEYTGLAVEKPGRPLVFEHSGRLE